MQVSSASCLFLQTKPCWYFSKYIISDAIFCQGCIRNKHYIYIFFFTFYHINDNARFKPKDNFVIDLFYIRRIYVLPRILAFIRGQICCRTAYCALWWNTKNIGKSYKTDDSMLLGFFHSKYIFLDANMNDLYLIMKLWR